jgi:hypothetical protein
MRLRCAAVGGWTVYLDDGRLVLHNPAQLGADVDLAGARADYSVGVPHSRSTVTRVATGAVLAGGLGAMVGGLSRKDKTKIYVGIDVVHNNVAGFVEFDVPAKEEKAVRAFVRAINR